MMKRLFLCGIALFILTTAGGCSDINIGMMSKLPVISPDEVIRNPSAFYKKPVQLYGKLTLVDDKAKKWTINNKIELFPPNLDLMQNLKEGEMIVVRGYFGKAKNSPDFYALYSAYYNPYNTLGHEQEILRLQKQMH